MARRRKSAPQIPVLDAADPYTYYRAMVAWDQIYHVFSWEIHSYSYPGIAPVAVPASGLAQSFDAAWQAIWVAAAELDILRDIGA